jgi:hypothetical protein
MARRLNNQANLAYGTPQGLHQIFPAPITASRVPAAADIGYPVGQVWINTTTNQSWFLTSVVAGAATWALASPGASDVDTINGLSPVAGNIVIAGGLNLTDVNAGNTVTLNLDPAITLATSVTSPIYASAGAMAINPVGALTVTGGAAIDINAAALSNITIQLGDAGGANILDIEDSTSATVASINSDGLGTFTDITSPIGVAAQNTIRGTTITANTAFAAPAATDLAINATAGRDIDITMGDAAGANNVTFHALGGAAVFTIDSLGGIGTLAGLTVAGNFAQTAGTFNVGQDNAANAINIGAGNVARAIAIGAGAGAHTVNIGSAAAGAIAIDTAAGFSIDGANTSNITVTSAGLDLNIQGVGCAVNMTSSEAQNDAIVIESSAANGGVQIRAGTGGILIGNEVDTAFITLGNIAPTQDRIITIASGTVVTAGVDDVVNIATDGATTNADSTKTVNINTGVVAVGVLATNINTGNVTSGTHTTAIATGNRAAGTMTTNVMTGTGTKTFNLGNADALTTCNIDAITLINDSVNAATSINTGNSTGTITIGNGLSGAIGVVGGAAVTIDAVGVLELNSSTGVIGIGNDAVAQNINIGTGAAARTITIGNNSGATSVVVNAGTGAASFGATATDHTTTIGSTTGVSATIIQSGTGDITVTGTVKEIDAEFLYASGDDVIFQASPVVQSALNTGVAPTGATGDVNIVMCQEGVTMEEFVIGAGQTILAPRMDANGLLISGDLTVAEGYEYNFGAARLNSRHAFTIGTSPAFFFEFRFRINDMDGADPYMFGFRKVEANNATWESYTDYAAIGMNAITTATQIVTVTELNSGGTTITNTTDNWGGDGTTNTLRVLVSAAGVVTYTINGAPPSVIAAFTFDNGDVVVPFIRLEHSASPTAVNAVWMKIGYQP